MIDDTTATPPSTLSNDERTWALLGHLSAFSAFFTAGFGCVLNVIGGFEGDLDEHGQRGRLSGWRKAGLPWKQG